MNEISDELVEAVNKMLPAYSARSIRAVLEAIAPDLLAQGMEKAAEMLLASEELAYFNGDGLSSIVSNAVSAIRASAATLRQGEKG